ncbi:hypothetical protein COT62_03560 [Candidatus Roizmanbacteria bacterium CG09_land_8_20_14_0_10_41_9]|uniref:Thioredoxin-like fold domain-containing protein n=1 Tax=Candidatus Roizmanbacteria bacterium CG09_land_8_20_14_0_10_41_9 TaxID=1974850 RepID=A0A2H0WS37_9BACT|nr:MAG: hypothetical protein COT62_03560 [Candidatus Roizmanbacteria bacterium CG09_land_8_20_14_0_10_41_9]
MEKTKKTKKGALFAIDFSKSKLPIILTTVALAIIAVVLFKLNFGNTPKRMKETVIPPIIKKVLNNGTDFALGTVKESSGVYEFELTLNPKSDPQKYVSYITKDGKILFTSGVKLDSLNAGQAETKGETTAKTVSCEDMEKVENPTLTAFVVSQCPYGVQMQRLFSKAMSEIPNLASALQVKYIGSVENGKITSMHGDTEAQENLRQICIREEQKEVYWPYVNCYMQEGKSEECLVSSGVNADLLKTCVEDPKKGIAYAEKDFADASKYSITGSPTLIVNDKAIVSEFDFGGRVVDALKQIVCCAGTTKGDYCTNDASKTEVSTAFSTVVDVTPGAAQTSAECATK